MNFFDGVFEFFSSVWLLISNFFMGLITALQVVVSASSLPLHIAPYCTPLIFTSVIVVSSIGIIKLLVGWGNS